MKNLSYEQIKNIVHGAVRIEEEGDGNISFFRFTKAQQELYKSVSPTDFYIKTFATAGVFLEFTTNSKNLSLCVSVSRGSSRTFFTHTVFVNNEKVDELSGDICDKENLLFSKDFSFENGTKTIKILFPWSVCSRLVSLKLDDNATVTPTNKNIKLLMFGDSITQGYDAFSPEITYASQVVNNFNAEAINKGIAGERFFPALVENSEDFKPDLITVAYGTNDWKYSTRETFTTACLKFFENLRSAYPNVKIIALSPIGRIDLVKSPNFDKPHRYVNQYIHEVAEKIDNMVVIDCGDFVPPTKELYQTDGVHPLDSGFVLYGQKLLDNLMSKGLL